MMLAPRPLDEVECLKQVRALDVLDTEPDLRIDCIAQYVLKTLKVPIAITAIIDEERLWFKSFEGVDFNELQRDTAICSHALYDIQSNNPDNRIYEVPDLCKDERFTDMPFVLNDPFFRSYASFVIQSRTGRNIGTFSVIDKHIRQFTHEEKHTIKAAGMMIENILLGRHYLTGIDNNLY